MSKQRMKIKYFVEEMQLSFNVMEGDKLVEDMDFQFADLPEDGDIRNRVSLYGLNKLLTDRTSDCKDKREKLGKMAEVMEQLASGEWAKERVVGAPVTGPEVEALAQLKELSVPQVQAALAEYDKETRKRILANPDVLKLAGELRAARKEAEVASLDDMLEEA